VRRVVWAGVLLLSFGVALSASTLSGRWDANLFFESDETGVYLEGDRWLSEVEMATEFRVDGWTFANVARFDLDEGLDIVKFAAAGALGAFDVVSSMTFDEIYEQFSSFAAVRTSIGGLGLWGGATLWNWQGPGPSSGAGFILGAYGATGDGEFYADIAFNMEGGLSPYIIYNGFEAAWERLMPCDLLGLMASTCDLGWSYLNLYAVLPLGCLDVETWTAFWRFGGFYAFHAWISDVDLGLGGLTLDRFEIAFAADSKSALFDLGLRVAETACITPYVSLSKDFGPIVPIRAIGPIGSAGGQVGGLSLDALELIWEIGDVTFVASELLGTPGLVTSQYLYVLGTDARVHRLDALGPGFGAAGAVGFAMSGTCFDVAPAREAIGIELRRDGCCGAAFSLGVYTFFDSVVSTATSLFDWAETRVVVEYQGASNLAVWGSVNVDCDQDVALGLGVEFLWGDLVIFGPEWENACCGFFFGPL
jgi:hypothetical protein